MRHGTAAVLVFLAAAGPVHAQAKPAPTDPEIAHIAVTANRIDSDLAKVAKTKSRNAQVVRFAETMMADHTSVIEQAMALVTKLHVTPQDNDISRALARAAQEATTRLQGLSGAAFDRAYMEREVAYHKAVIDAVRQVLIPNAKNGELQALLEKVAPVLDGHLRHAQEVQAALGR
jgi:putative membrane protein